MSRERGRVLIGTRRYEMDITKYARRPLAAQREQVDQNTEPGEGTLASTTVWDRSGRDFVEGAGQEYFDEEGSDRARFRTSTGIDPWEKRTLKLLKRTAEAGPVGVTPSNGLLIGTSGLSGDRITMLATVGGVPWAAYTYNGTDWFAMTSLPTSGTWEAVATDGRTIYASVNTSIRIYRFTEGSQIATVFSDTGLRLTTLAFVNGRLLGGTQATGSIYEVDDTGAKTLHHQHPSKLGNWHAFTAAPNGIYAVHTLFGRSSVFYIGVDDDGSLATPVVVLPTQREIGGMIFAAGTLVIGLARGVQVARIGPDNSLNAGPIVETEVDPDLASPLIRHFFFDGQYVWFGQDTDTSNTDNPCGLGRIDMANFTSEVLAPAWANDLRAGGSPASIISGEIRGITQLDGRLWFLVHSAAPALWVQDDEYVQFGTYRSGWITYGIPYDKTFVGASVVHDPLPAGAGVELALIEHDGTNRLVLTSHTGRGGTAAVGDITDEMGEVEIVLARSTDDLDTPRLHRWTLRALPRLFRSEEIYLPLRLADTVDFFDHNVTLDTAEEWAYLKALEASRERVECAIGAESFFAYVDAVAVDPEDSVGWNSRGRAVEGVVMVKLVTVDLGG